MSSNEVKLQQICIWETPDGKAACGLILGENSSVHRVYGKAKVHEFLNRLFLVADAHSLTDIPSARVRVKIDDKLTPTSLGHLTDDNWLHFREYVS